MVEVEPEKKKRNALPEPSIKIGKVSPLGTISIEFNQPMFVPEPGYDYSQTF